MNAPMTHFDAFRAVKEDSAYVIAVECTLNPLLYLRVLENDSYATAVQVWQSACLI